MKMQIALLSLTTLFAQTAAFSPLSGISTTPEHATRMSPLFMGRAAAVRAATKSKTDLKKAKTNALYGKKIVMAVKQGGSPSPDANKQLADVIKQAKANNVPVDNINRAIKKASEANVGDFAESTFEAYGFGGASMVINVLSDNPNRANADVKSTVTKRKGKMAESGSVLFMYDRKGKVDVPDAVVDEEALLDAAIEADIEDFLLEEGDGEGSSTILVEPTDAAKMLDVVKEMGFEQAKMELCYISKAPVECTDEDFEGNMNIIDALEELDDVDSVEHNMSN
jgi:YebC/PmpR family DNA-binding regulatory protein